MPGVHKNLFVSDGYAKSFTDICTFGLLATLAYEEAESIIFEGMRQWLGFNTTIKTSVNLGTRFPFFGMFSDEGAVFSVTGTNSIPQGLFYIALAENIPAVGIDAAGLTHAGFYVPFLAIKDRIVESLSTYPADLPLAFTGHSLGGALAQMLACWFKVNTSHPVANCVVFSSPKWGTQTLVDIATRIPVLSIRIFGDLVPSLPPDFFATSLLGLLPLVTNAYLRAYGEPPVGWVMQKDGTREWRGFEPSDNLAFRAFYELLNIAGVEVDDPITSLLTEAHPITNVLKLCFPWRRRVPFGDADLGVQDAFLAAMTDAFVLPSLQEQFTDAQLLNMIANSGITPKPPPPPAPPPTPALFHMIHSDCLILNQFAGSLRPGDQDIRRVAYSGAPGGAVDPLVFGEKQRPHWLFRGSDRRLLQELIEVFDAIRRRDQLVVTGQRTNAVSTEQPIIDPTNLDLLDAFEAIASQASMLLSLYLP